MPTHLSKQNWGRGVWFNFLEAETGESSVDPNPEEDSHRDTLREMSHGVRTGIS